MKRRIFSLFLALCLVFSFLPAALAAESDYSGYDGGDCGQQGDNLRWVSQSMDRGALGKLIIYGQGAMKNYDLPTPQNGFEWNPRSAPWDDLRKYRDVAKLVLEEGITTIGNAAFASCSGLTGELVLPSTLERIGYAAFDGCHFTGAVTIPASVTQISDYAFRDTNLTGIFFEGDAPELGTYYPFDNDITLYFRAGTSGWTDSPYYSSMNGTWHGYRLQRIGGSDLDEAIPGSIHWASFDARPGSFPDSMVDGVYIGGEGTTLMATERLNGSYLLQQIPPDPVREGYTFAGWRINFVDNETDPELTGQLVRNLASLNFPADLTFEADWTTNSTYTVAFNLNGKSGAVPQSQQVAAGGTVSLPVPTASDGSKFICWGYTEDNKTLKEWKADYPVNENLTLYAAWEDSVVSTQAYFGYSFGNNEGVFGYSKPYQIPYARYVLIYGDTVSAQQTYAAYGNWIGNCYGMSSSSVLFATGGNDVSASSFRSGASMPKDLSVRDYNGEWGINLTEFIEAMQISETTYLVSQNKSKHLNDLNGMCQAVLAAKAAGQGYPLIALYGPNNGHTVVGYDLVDVDATTSRLMVYDPNYPNNTERYIALQKNGSGQYTGWYFKYNNTYNWGTGYSGSMMTYVTYDCYSSLWRKPGTEPTFAVLNIGSDSAIVRDKAGNTVATVKNGVVSANRANIYPVTLTDSAWSGAAVWLPVDSYTVTNTDRTAKTFDVTMTNVDQSAAVSTTGSTVSFTVDDGKRLNYVQLDEAGAAYTITLTSTLDTGLQNVCLSGTVADSALTFAQSNGKLYAAGATDSNLQINGASVSAAENLSGELNIGRVDSPTPAAPSGNSSFTDVPSGAWYAGAVAYMAERGLMSGTGNNKFSPGATTTRGMVMTMLAHLNGVDTSGGSTWYEKGMQWAKTQGISDGTNPGGTISREQLVAMLYRYAGSPAVIGSLSGYPDASAISKWAVDSMQWAVANGLISGTDTGALNPGGTATRAEVAIIMMHFCETFAD